ncbi:putative gustatory receptor 59b [Drosophila guanche]|uniref:Gustatory receptor n=1 Tax=Drosophila guanche TaxID=7266 RepID=A0A3B0J2Y2_DROGU|nr:putative gustatory receptor 59b [Drosophila guanche]SPP73533.1 blast:Putative gustatory receptor 59b [Drosophila guanche]
MSNSLVQLYFGYALAIGITSNRFVDSTFGQTCFSKWYALAVNIATLVLTPPLLLESRNGFKANETYPHLLLITFQVRYLVAYGVIAYTVLSRGFRDRALKEMQPLLTKLLREEKRNGKQRVRRSLQVTIYLKFSTAAFVCLTIFVFSFHSGVERNWRTVAGIIFLSNALNILQIVPMGYFLALWHIARGFDYVNQRLDDILAATPTDMQELRRIWALHAALTRTAIRINKIYGPQMMAIRFDNFIFGVINAYWGTFFSLHSGTNILWVVFGALAYCFRCLDSYLIDYVSDLAMHYQSSPKHAWSEGYWSQDINSYVTYLGSSKLQLWTCGLYKENRSLWFDTTSSILYYYIMLLQFHLVLRN